MTLNLRTTLLLGYAIVVSLMGAFSIFTGLTFLSDAVVSEAKLRVQSDLSSAWITYNEEKALLQTAVSIIAQREDIQTAITQKSNVKDVLRQLDKLRIENGLDFLLLLDKNGKTIRARNSDFPGDLQTPHTVVHQALQGRVVSGTTLLTADELKQFEYGLADKAYIPLISTERARPTTREVEDRGMVIESALPVYGKDGKICGAIYGGILMNRRFDLVDRIRKAVFDIDYYEGKPLGTVTIFLWDTRIATNVIKSDTTRAIGTRVSDEVYRKVLEKGERWGDRAFVVNDWYLSAYDPIKDPSGKIIGILYVGLLEKKYLDYKSSITIKFLGMGLIVLLMSSAFAIYLTRKIRKWFDRLKEATRKISNGELSARVTTNKGSQYMRELGHSFNSMAASLEMRSNQLEKASQKLQEAYQKADEKNRAYLEMLGFVTHELKSPLASIVFAIESLRDKALGPINKPQEGLLRSSAKSAHYLNNTIANFLNLSRIEEGALKLKLEQLKPQESICQQSVQRLSEVIADNDMKIDCRIPEDVVITGDADLLTSVFHNIISNAVKYGDEGSTIISNFEETESDYVFSIYNDGIGFSKEEGDELFTKFSRFSSEKYNTKSGTGLGLFVTKMIIDKHGGTISAESEEGKWAKFTFTIPKTN